MQCCNLKCTSAQCGAMLMLCDAVVYEVARCTVVLPASKEQLGLRV